MFVGPVFVDTQRRAKMNQIAKKLVCVTLCLTAMVLALPSEVDAQYPVPVVTYYSGPPVTVYYPPAPTVVYRPVPVQPVTVQYVPAPAVYYPGQTTVVYRPGPLGILSRRQVYHSPGVYVVQPPVVQFPTVGVVGR